MRALPKLVWTELKLFLREPVTVIFTLALPLMVLYILGGVFGNETTSGDGEFVVYRGFGATDWYTPAYVALAVAGFALIAVPSHMVEYRQTGVLRRFRASGLPQGVLLGSQLAIGLVVSSVGAALLLVAAFAFTDVGSPVSAAGFGAAYVLGAFAIVLFGVMLGTILPTARSAQSVGLLLWFVLLFLSGSGPPPEVLPTSLATVGDWLPLTPVVELLQEPWLTGEWATQQALVATAIAAVAGSVSWFGYRWE